MKVVKLGSATVVIKTDDVNILCDPWLTDGIYYGSWCNYPPINLDYCDFSDIDYVLETQREIAEKLYHKMQLFE